MRVTYSPSTGTGGWSNDSLLTRANAAAARWDDENVLSDLRDAASKSPGDALRWQLLGVAQRNLDAHADALVSFHRAVELAPANALLAHSLARTALEAGQPALDLYARAHALAPLDARVLLGRAAAQFAEQAPETAIQGLRDQLREHPAWYEGHATVARLHWLSGESARLGESFEAALLGRPNDGVLWRDYAHVVLRAGQYEQVGAIVARARRALGASRILDLIEAASHSEAGSIPAADTLFAPHLPVEDSYLPYYVRHLLRAGRADQAATLLEGRIAGDPTRELLPLATLAWRLTGDPRGDQNAMTTAIRMFDLANHIPSLDDLAHRLRSLHRAAHHPLDQSLRGGTQTDGPLFARLDPEIRQLRGVILQAVRDYVDALPPPVPNDPLLGERRDRLRFAGSWSVRLTDGGHHVDHVHPAGWISSAFYVAVPDGAEGDPGKAGWLTLGDAPSLGLPLAPIAEIAPKPGRLILFPSATWHRTNPFPKGERLTVAFDIARAPR